MEVVQGSYSVRTEQLSQMIWPCVLSKAKLQFIFLAVRLLLYHLFSLVAPEALVDAASVGSFGDKASHVHLVATELAAAIFGIKHCFFLVPAQTVSEVLVPQESPARAGLSAGRFLFQALGHL